MSSSPPIRVGPSQLAAAFPFYLTVNPQLQLTDLGPSIPRVLPSLKPGDELWAHFEIDRPVLVDQSFAALTQTQGELLILLSPNTGTRFRGQLLPDTSRNQLLFLIRPWLTSFEALVAAGLELSDFGPHDPLADLLLLLQTKDTALHDLRHLMQQLQLQNTQLKAARKAAEDAQRNAEQASEAKTQFLATMSHEIRTPLHPILAHTELMLETPMEAEQHNALATIRQSGQHLLQLIDNVLDVSKIEAGQMSLENTPFDLRDVMNDVSELHRPQAARKGLSLHTSIDPATPLELRGDSARLRQIISNFMSNAIKFTESGQLDLSAHSGQDGGIRIKIRDTGPGIPANELPGLFDAYVQATRSTARHPGGSGLGLNICHQLATLMGGTVGATSAQGSGSLFFVDLPSTMIRRAPGDRATPSTPTEAPAYTPGDGTSNPILIVDDNHINRLIAEAILRRLELPYTSVDSGAEALRYCDEQTPAMILMDLEMPGLDGYATTIALRRRDDAMDRVPIIALSASAFPADRIRAQEAGMNDFLPKPYSKQELSVIIARALRRPDLARG